VTAYGHAVAAPGFGSYVAGDGGIVSTATDMARWLIVNTHNGQAADGTPIVSSRGLRLLHTPSAPRVGYALGWSTRGPANAPTRLEHSGSLFTFTSEQAIWPGTGYGVVLLFNSGSPMVLDQTAIAHDVFDIIEGTTPRTSTSPTTTPDLVLGALSLLALTLGTVGAVRARSWARRRRGGPVSTTLRMVPAVLMLAVGTTFPLVAEALVGRDATWRAVAYEWPALLVLVGAGLLAAAATVIARAWAWSTARRAARDLTTPDRTSVGPVTSANVPETTQKAVAATAP
jgi:hypothetical protein